jgi:integrase
LGRGDPPDAPCLPRGPLAADLASRILDPSELSDQRARRLASRVGLAGVRLHDLRHFWASELLRRNVHPKIVSEGLGHSSVAFTMDVYAHLLPTMQEQASAAIEAALSEEAT